MGSVSVEETPAKKARKKLFNFFFFFPESVLVVWETKISLPLALFALKTHHKCE